MLNMQMRQMLNKYITEICALFNGNRKKLYDKLLENYNLPIDLSSDIITLKKDIGEFSDFIAYAILSVLDELSIKKYFNDKEINVYSSAKYTVEIVKFPICLNNMIQVNDDQWIGKISCKELMALKNARLINYNENAQRTLERVVNGETEYWKIAINKKSVNEIRQSLEKGIYISDDITINLPPETTEFEYKGNTIIISTLKTMDLLDGYHRYLAISQICNFDKEFDYNMELRIVCYPIEKAQQFIYQKDQKTQMRRSSSKSYNQYSLSNRVVQMINQDPMCFIQGMISRNKGIIDAGQMAMLIDYFYFKSAKIENENLAVLKVKNKLVQQINNLISRDDTYLKQRYDEETLIIVMYLMYKGEEDISKATKYIKSNINAKKTLFNLYNRVSKSAITLIDKCYIKWKENNNV